MEWTRLNPTPACQIAHRRLRLRVDETSMKIDISLDEAGAIKIKVHSLLISKFGFKGMESTIDTRC